MPRKSRRVLRGLAILCGSAVLALLLGALLPHGTVPGSGEGAGQRSDPGGGTHRVLILANAIHTDVALPAEPSIRERFAFLEAAGLPVGRADWLVFGRGGRSFYVETPTWSDLRPVPLLRAVTLDDAVMHVGLAGPLEEDATTRAVVLDDAAFRALAGAIATSFADRAAIPGAGYGPDDRFFEATGAFNALLGCNAWTGAMLREAGVATGLWTPLPRLLLWSLDLHDRSGS